MGKSCMKIDRGYRSDLQKALIRLDMEKGERWYPTSLQGDISTRLKMLKRGSISLLQRFRENL
jgi:hypothetical protein